MFRNCTSLNYIKCLATANIESSTNIYKWVDGVSSSGAFIKKRGVSWPSGDSGIPDGWTVQDV